MKYELVWPGKEQAKQMSLTPSKKILVEEENFGSDETNNLIIEGDNLEVLKISFPYI